jgi:FkbM family methyltransferase
MKALQKTYTNVNIIDPDCPSLHRNFTCIETKEVFNLYRTTLCLHSKRDTVSESVAVDRIWEDGYLKRLLSILIRNPGMDMIDIGANIGGFTMFTAGALGRFTLAVECYLPSIERIARAIQIQKAQNRVVLVQNALYSVSGKYLTITKDDPSGIRLLNETTKNGSTNEFVVKTIQFDDLLPILIERNVETAMIKIDIETSESYMCQTGSKIFDRINIPYVMMEWNRLRVHHKKRYQFIIDFFTARNYVATDDNCKELKTEEWLKTWPGNIFWIKRTYPRELLCKKIQG